VKTKIGILVLILAVIISCKTELTAEEKESYSKKGVEIAQASFKQLSSELTKQMKAGGPELAIPFCNTQASPLIKELEEKYSVVIKRTSDKIRNPKNKATSREREIIDSYKNLIGNNEKLAPVVELDMNSAKHFYTPIVLKSNCIVCHGKPGEDIAEQTIFLLESLYPADMAIGYKEGDLRGIWSVAFKN